MVAVKQSLDFARFLRGSFIGDIVSTLQLSLRKIDIFILYL